MKVLFLCNKSPYPPREGGPIAMNNLIEGLAKAGHKIKVLAINSNKYSVRPEEIPMDYQQRTQIEHVYVDLSIKPVDAFCNLFTNKSYHVQRFISKDFSEKLSAILKDESFDVIQLETLFMGAYIPLIRKLSSAKIVLRAHNIEYLIWERISNATKNPIKKFYLKHLSKTLKSFELNTINEVDGIASITEKDGSYFRDKCNTPVTSISFGLDVNKFPSDNNQIDFPSIYHLGSMNWMPNEEGIQWFLNNVWPLVLEKNDKLILYLAGREMPEWLSKSTKYKNVDIIGEVPDAINFIQNKAISIVPLLSGSGIRIKIIEAMAMGKAVVSTTIGAEGINYMQEEDLYIADKAEDFANAIIKLAESKILCSQVGEKARMLIKNDHNSEKIIPKLIGFYNTLIKKEKNH
ncbi:MAG: glycosyltransferase family 4 protein [Hyphomicrobiales bacterium]